MIYAITSLSFSFGFHRCWDWQQHNHQSFLPRFQLNLTYHCPLDIDGDEFLAILKKKLPRNYRYRIRLVVWSLLLELSILQAESIHPPLSDEWMRTSDTTKFKELILCKAMTTWPSNRLHRPQLQLFLTQLLRFYYHLERILAISRRNLLKIYRPRFRSLEENATKTGIELC